MASSSNVTAAQVEAPPKMLPPREHTKEVLHQRYKLPYCPLKMAIGGFAIVVTLGYFTLYSQKMPEASTVDVARVTTGVASPENTNPPK